MLNLWNNLNRTGKIVVVSAIAIVGITATACWCLWSPKPSKQEVYAPAERQPDGSTILEKKPQSDYKPPMQLPKGAKLERVVKITVQAKAPLPSVTGTVEVRTMEESPVMAKSSAHDHIVDATESIVPVACPPVTVDLALVQMPDDTRRVVASSIDGEILGGVDIPVENAKPAAALKLWAVGALYNPIRQTAGITLERDLGFLRLGADLMQRDAGGVPTEPVIRAMVIF